MDDTRVNYVLVFPKATIFLVFGLVCAIAAIGWFNQWIELTRETTD